jgi:hypothetical protein
MHFLIGVVVAGDVQRVAVLNEPHLRLYFGAEPSQADLDVKPAAPELERDEPELDR